MSKVCSVCGVEKPLTEFYLRNKASGKYKAECKRCHGKDGNIRAKHKRNTDATYKNTQNAKRRSKYKDSKEYRDKVKLSRAKYVAKLRLDPATYTQLRTTESRNYRQRLYKDKGRLEHYRKKAV